MNLPIYLDYASTTPVDPVVAEKMMAVFNPSGILVIPPRVHTCFGWQAEAAIEDGSFTDVAELNRCGSS